MNSRDNSQRQHVRIEEVTSERFAAALFSNTPYTQTETYALWQERAGKKVVRLLVYKNNECIGTCVLVQYTGPMSLSFLYAPYGPVLRDTSADVVALLVQTCKKIAHVHRVVFVRLELDTPAFSAPDPAMYVFSAMQPRYEWYLDISQTPADTLAQMHKNTRYSIRVAEKAGVDVHIYSDNIIAHFETFMTLMRATAHRDHFSLHPESYYKALCETLEKYKSGFLVVVSYNNIPLVANVFMIHGSMATHVFGGSSDTYRDVYASYAAHARTIAYLHQHNIAVLNFGGYAPDASPTDSWYGFSQFKKRFGGYVVPHAQFLDVVHKPVWYKILVCAKKIKKIF